MVEEEKVQPSIVDHQGGVAMEEEGKQGLQIVGGTGSRCGCGLEQDVYVGGAI